VLLSIPVLLAAVAATAWAYPGGHLTITFDGLRQLDSIASTPIGSLDDATAYVGKAAALCGITDLPLALGDIGSRLAAAELDAAKDPDKVVSDGQVAEAFNFMSDKFQVPHPAHLTASDIVQYRSVMASIFPHIFSPKRVSGSRPVGVVVMLYQLWYNGGITDGVKKAAQLDRPPGSLKVTGGRIIGRSWTPNENTSPFAGEYQAAGLTYLRGLSPDQLRSFLDQLARIIAPREGGQL
jgi:hypothetical protein